MADGRGGSQANETFTDIQFNSCKAFDDNKSKSSLSNASHTSSQLSTLNTAGATLRAFGISNLLSKSSGLILHEAQHVKQGCKGVNKALNKQPLAKQPAWIKGHPYIMARQSLYCWNQFSKGLEQEDCGLGQREVYLSRAGWQKHSAYNELMGVQ